MSLTANGTSQQPTSPSPMRIMAVNCSWANAQLSKRSNLQRLLPQVLIDTIQASTGSQYLDAIATAAAIPGCTEDVFELYRPLTTEIANRLIRTGQSSSRSDQIRSLSALTKILPFAIYLIPQTKVLLTSTHLKTLLFDRPISGPLLQDVEIASLLLSLFRLLSTDIQAFQDAIKPTFLSSFLSHDALAIRYLAIQCLCAVMHFADDLSEKLVEKHIGLGPILGQWEGREIDFRILKLLEEKRWTDLTPALSAIPDAAQNGMRVEASGIIDDRDWSDTTADFAGILVPRNESLQAKVTNFVRTETSTENLRNLGYALLQSKPILVNGPTGTGKTSLIMESARLLNYQQSVLTLHLNDQTDAKSLIGLYTSSSSGDSFEWRPGILTKAIQQGRWVLIEDIDRAPSEVLGMLKPILEEGSLFLPTRKERIRPAAGFRIFATIKSSSRSSRGGQFSWLTSERLWTTMYTSPYQQTEIQELLLARYPHIRRLIPELIRAHVGICTAYQEERALRSQQARVPTLRDLLKWCRRISLRTEMSQHELKTGILPDAIRGNIYQDGIDCYATHHADDNAFSLIAQALAEALNISPQQMEFLLSSAAVALNESKTSISIGRSVLGKVVSSRMSHRSRAVFATTSLAQMILNSAAAAIQVSEPLLLVGETGVGKTTSIQHVARLVGQKLTVINLSQQSEATDLLGGLKPINTRSVVIPLMDTFNSLFDDTFSTRRNEKFRSAVAKSFAKQNWSRLVLLWQEAIQMAGKALKPSVDEKTGFDEDGQLPKRRKLISKHTELQKRWEDFVSKANHVRAQIKKGDKNHTFSYVEGKLVEAVRNGEWLLLDEINLAAAETLDHIVSLLHDGEDVKPSLLLTESGSLEPVVAHPSFRIFAAMNPATDTGKKDLTPGIRGRFTELFVQSGDSKIDDLIQIIEAYLGTILSSDRRAAHDLAKGYLELKDLNNQQKLTDGAGDMPHFSIRSLVRCLLYTAHHSHSHGLRRAMYEGFAMSFFTVLSREAEKLAMPVVSNCILASIKNHGSFLSQQPKFKFDSDQFVAFQHHLVPRGPNDPDLQPHYIRTPCVERNLMNLARAASIRRFPILLQGPTSAGKTSMVEYLSKLSGNRFVRVNNHEHTDLQEYLGSYATNDDGKIEFREGVLVDALRHGHWIVLDELNLAPTDVLEALNRLLDDNRELLIPETQEIVKPHPNFMLFATQNPAGLYGGRKRLSRAFRNRFLELHFDDIPEDELEVILQRRSQIPQSFCNQIVQVYRKLSLQRQATKLFEQKNSFATLRDLFRWASRPIDDRKQLAQHGFMLLGERARSDAERNIVKNTIEQTMKVEVDEANLYSLSRIPRVLYETSVVWTPAMIRLFVLVSEALKNNEPVLLVGETGCGKTQICQTVSDGLGRNLSIYNAHANTETGDLIGSQRPIRSRAELMTTLLDSFTRLSPSMFQSASMPDVDIDTLISQFTQMDPSSLDPEAMAHTKQSIAAYQSLFAWNDGSLVRSMKAGEHFLLDEISLADDSVLERLNSVLEPSRTILLAEKGPVDSLVVAHPSFQFLATMNPGGDYGKRELSTALRNRLTEIWVPPLSREDDILPILEASLGSDLRSLAPLLLNFATWFKSTWQNSTASALPLRNLLAWTDFIKRNRHLETNAAFLHGAALVYVDSIGANPAGLMATGSDIATARSSCLHKLQDLIGVDAPSIYSNLPELNMSPTHFSIGEFSLSRTLSSSIPDLVFDASTTLKNTMRIVRALQMSRPILLEGSPGVGKTAIVTALAEAVGKSFTRINLSDQTDLMDLFGADSPSENENIGHFSWRDGPLLQAMHSGGWVLLDEMNLASQSVLEGLNSCLDHRQQVYIAELDRTFTCHPDFVLFAAQNPHHQGGGRKGLPASFVNRFTVVFADPFESDDLVRISQQKRPSMSADSVQSVVLAIMKVQEAVTKTPALASGGPWELNLRDVMRWLDLCQTYPTFSPGSHFDVLVTNRFRDPRSKKILTSIRDEVFGKVDEKSLYHCLLRRQFQLGMSTLSRSAGLQHMQTRYQLMRKDLSVVESAMLALNSNWPILLSGPSGCGKTEMIRILAALNGTKLVEFSMNSEIDTMDIVGGLEQHDDRRDHQALQHEAVHFLKNLICMYIIQAEQQPLHLLMDAYEKASQHNINLYELTIVIRSLSNDFPVLQSLSERCRRLEQDATKFGPRFVWNDGLLLDALREGSWLVLDNANLCNPSVLDRLNSLLEPKGSLIISEQHAMSQEERLVRPHPNFRLFLTTDPKFGELSRAMRNRSLELFMEPLSQQLRSTNTPRYPATASIHTLREVTAEIGNPTTGSYDVEARIETLPRSQQTLLAQQLNHLVVEDCHHTFQSQLDTWTSMTSSLQKDITLFYDRALQKVQLQRENCDAKSLPQLPLVNEPFLNISQTNGRLAEGFTRYVLFSLQVQKLSQRLASIRSTDHEEFSGALSMLQASSYPIKHPRMARSRRIVPAYQFLSILIDGMAQKVYSKWSPSQQAVLEFASDLFMFFDQNEIDYSVLQAYLRIGETIVSTGPNEVNPLKDTMLKGVKLFGSQIKLTTGKSFQLMWEHWRPPQASSWEQLEDENSMEALLLRFDQLSVQLPLPRNELAALRLKLTHSLQNFASIPDSSASLKSLSQAIQDLASQHLTKTSSEGHFTAIFQWLLRNLGTDPTTVNDLQLQRIFLLSRAACALLIKSDSSPLTRSLNLLAFLGHVPKMTKFIDTFSSIEACRHLIRRAEVIKQAPLRNLEEIRQEIPELMQIFCAHASQIGSQAMSTVKEGALEMVRGILTCHTETLSPEATECLLNWSSAQAQQQLSSIDRITVDSDGSEYLQEVFATYIRPAQRNLMARNAISVDELGSSLVQICLGALHLLVPDRLFDPAVYPALVNKRREWRITELTARVEAHRSFQQQLTGQDTSSMIRMYENDLCSLGAVTLASTVLRPAKSELDSIQEVFVNVIQNIVQNTEIEDAAISKTKLSSANVDKFGRIISSLVERLTAFSSAYNDIVIPISQLLESLYLGMQMCRQSHGVAANSVALDPLGFVPLLGTSPTHIISWAITPDISNYSAAVTFQFLQHLEIERHMSSQNQGLPSSKIWNFLAAIDKFYKEWKLHLSKDQAEAEAKSRYYRYRGGDENNLDEEKHEQENLFPTFETEEQDARAAEVVSDPQHYDSRNIAIKLAKLHTSLFDIDVSEDLLKECILRGLRNWAVSPIDQRYPSRNFSDLLPGIILELDDVSKSISNQDMPPSFNVYTDTSISEVKSIEAIVRKVQNRFETITLQWPEHAVPVETLTYCEEFLSFQIDEPIAKLLTKTEKLLEIVARWQSVASREWSVISLVEELTAKIVHWRRLELMSWSKLLDIEQAKNEEDASSWYFIAYEAIIHNSMVIIEQKNDVRSYCLELAKSLEEFFTSATLGQYAYRLRLVNVLAETLQRINSQDGKLNMMVGCIKAVYYHYKRFEHHAQQTLSNGRTELERNVREQIQLASWKDVNVQSLKESARRSHNKLFRIVKKYRALLAQPVTIFQAIDPLSSTDTALPPNATPSASTENLQKACDECSTHLEDWEKRPERLRDPVGAASSMQKLYSSVAKSLTVHETLSEMIEDIRTTSDELRRQTPSVHTEDNASLIRHLRGRKRRLFADTLKNVSHMGIRRNLGMSELNCQISTATVLANTPDLPNLRNGSISHSANFAFHQVLDNMAGVRTASREHSNDLSDGEVGRAVGLLEGILAYLSKQRVNLHKANAELDILSSLMQTLRPMVDTPVQHVFPVDAQESEYAEQLYQQSLWLCEIVRVSCYILEVSSQYTNKSSSKAIAILSSRRSEIRALQAQIVNRDKLPAGVEYQDNLDALIHLQDLFQQTHSELKEVEAQEPESGLIIAQILPWLVVPTRKEVGHDERVQTDISGFDTDTRLLLDGVFVVMQKVALVRRTIPESTEDQGWLTRSTALLDDAMKALHVHDINNRLQRILAQLPKLKKDKLGLGIYVLTVATPVLEEYCRIAADLYEQQIQAHLKANQLAVLLTKSFASLAKEGFCHPPEPSDGQDQDSGKLESGTGLGEGEGAEDISKDVGEDEDLSELAQAETQQKEEGQEMDQSGDAVDMGTDDLNGETQSVEQSESGSDDEMQGSDDEANEMDEETGSVDELDPSAVDEKMWDDMKNESDKSDKDMKSDKQKGSKSDDQTAKKDGEQQSDEGNDQSEDDGGDATDADEDREGEGKPEAENIDPHLQEQEALDLPEDMQIGEEEGQKDDTSDGGMDELSDVEQNENLAPTEEVEDMSEGEQQDELDEGGHDQDVSAEDEEREGHDSEHESMDGLSEGEKELDESKLREDDMAYDIDDNNAGEKGQANQQQSKDNAEQEDDAQGQNETGQVVEEQQAQSGKGSGEQQEGSTGQGVAEKGAGREDNPTTRQDDALKKLADAIETFHQRREILTANEERQEGQLDEDVDMADADFEHLGEEEISDAQALGAANAEQAQKIDQRKAIEDSTTDVNEDLPMPDDHEVDENLNEQESIAERLSRLQTQSRQNRGNRKGELIPHTPGNRQQADAFENMGTMEEEEESAYDRADEIQVSQNLQQMPTSAVDATELWTRCSTSTHALSLILTEQLRLILAPTTATKLRGDFRTGKRLNIKRIIPYIASGYKRDKIWMRRSIPSKRNYQVMIAVDDSKSMSESGADLLAFETVAMLCKSLSMLEVGELCVVNFGEEQHIRVAHPFNQPFSSPDSGIEIFQHFSFAQQGTNVRNLVRESISLFEDARLRAGQSTTGSDLWQLELIVSDGHCSDHDSIRQLVRAAREQKIMIVFVIVDAGQDSIMDLKQAVFERSDPLDRNSEMTVKTRRYLEDFPFQYYVIVRDVADLPGVLAQVLKGWFESVVDT